MDAPPQLDYEGLRKLDPVQLVAWLDGLGLPEDMRLDGKDKIEMNEISGDQLCTFVDEGDAGMFQWIFDNADLRDRLTKTIEARRGAGGGASPASDGKAEAEKLAAATALRELGSELVLPRCDDGARPYLQQPYRQFSAIHALNGLFCNEESHWPHKVRGGRPYLGDPDALFTREDLDALEKRMMRDQALPRRLFIKPYCYYTGQYGPAVVERAVTTLGYRWDDFCAPYSSLLTEALDLPSVAGFLVRTGRVGLCSGPRCCAVAGGAPHWYCIRSYKGSWWRLDDDLSCGAAAEPFRYSSVTDVCCHLQHIADHGGTIHRVRRPAPNLYAFTVDDVVALLDSLGLGEAAGLPYAARCRAMHVDGFWLSRCTEDDLSQGRPCKKVDHVSIEGFSVTRVCAHEH